jgi:hypothetical protein
MMARGTIQTEHMQEVLTGLPSTGTEQAQGDWNGPKERKKTSHLKFYIHDSVGYFRIELIGELTDIDIHELDGCWSTARSSVTGRKLALDVRSLKAVDEAGRQWLASMTRAGACYITGKDRSGVFQVLPDWRPGNTKSDDQGSTPKLWRSLLRIMSFSRLPEFKPTR